MSKINDGDTIHRRKRFFKDNKNICTVVTKSTKKTGLDRDWYNCIYLVFLKSDFPNLNYPEIKPCSFREGELAFDYFNCDLAELDWHGGITYYTEEMILPNKKIIVTAGADYQHLYDDHYGYEDYGQRILESEADNLYKEFMTIASTREGKNE